MKLNRVLTALTPLMLIAGAAFAATSGLPAETRRSQRLCISSAPTSPMARWERASPVSPRTASVGASSASLCSTVSARWSAAASSQVQPAAAALGLSAGATLGSGSFQIGDHHRLVAFLIGAVISTLIALVRRPQEQVAI